MGKKERIASYIYDELNALRRVARDTELDDIEALIKCTIDAAGRRIATHEASNRKNLC
jgi:hypothetical protein